MKLSGAHIENYRSIKNMDIDFSKCNVFVGKNNTGKSNVLKAIDLVLGPGYYHLSNNDFYDQDENLTIIINLFFNDFSQAEIDDIKSNIIYNVNVDGVRYQSDEIRGELDTKREIRVETEISGGSINKKLFIGDIYYKYFSNELRNSIVNTTYIPSIRDTSQMTITYRNTVFNNLLKKVYEECPKNKKDELNASLETVSEKIKSIFQDCEIRLDQISKEIINHEGINVRITPSDYGEIYKKLHIMLDDGVESELEYKGTGIQSVIIICLFKVYSELVGGSSILLIEEPESFLHPHANRHMAKILKEIAETQNMQLIITTHSPHNILINNIENIFLFKKNGKQTVKKQIGTIPNEIKLKKELNAENLELFFSDKVLLVEGVTEKFIIPKLAKELNVEYDFDRKNISIIEMGSKSNLDVFASLLNAFEIKWTALVDRDFCKKAESTALMKKINDMYSFGFDIDSETESNLIVNFKTKNIFCLSHGEIENYYTLNSLLGILESYIEDFGLNPGALAWVQGQLSGVDETTDLSVFLPRFFSTLRPDVYIQDVLNKIINIKKALHSLNLDENKVSKKLEDIFRGLDLTKPRIAIKLVPYLKLSDMTQNKKEDLEESIRIVFQ